MSQGEEIRETIANRYELIEQLGSGGMGAVYLAHDLLTGERVALKRVRTQASDSLDQSINYRMALAQEFSVLASLRHPYIVGVRDYGFDADRQPYVTMELVSEARDLFAAAYPRTLEEKIQFLIQLLQALAYLHRRRVLHRDLKPANVLVTAQDIVKVVDFGLATEPEKAEGVLGTLSYIAPEVLLEENATEASDLYAVGVMAYELFTGKHPFDSPDVRQFINNILTTNPDLSPLDRLSTTAQSAGEPNPTLLKEDMPTRIEIADDIEDEDTQIFNVNMTNITDIDEEQTQGFNLDIDTPGEQTQAFELDLRGPDEGTQQFEIDLNDRENFADTLGDLRHITDEFNFNLDEVLTFTHDASFQAIVGKLLAKVPEYRYHDAYTVIKDLSVALGQEVPEESTAIRQSFLEAATFVGRETEIARLDDALTLAIQETGSSWLIGGESGVGKSRLLNELRTRALVQGVTVLRGQGVFGGGLPYQLWREPVRRLLLAVDVTDTEGSVLKDIILDIERLEGRHFPDAVELSGTKYHERLMGAIVSMFQRNKQPMLLLVEDLQWSAESLDVLRLLNSNVWQLPLMIVGSYSHDERPTLPDELPQMESIRLERFNQDEITALSASMLGEAGEQPRIIERLQHETEGNAYFLVEVVRALAEEAGRLSHVGHMSLPADVIAGGVQTVIQRRLARVPDDYRALLRLAAVSGRELDLSVLRSLAGTVALDDWLTICANSAVLERQDENWRFAHEKMRQVILSNIADDELPDSHAQVATAIEQTYPDDLADHAVSLVQHWHNAGNTAKERVYGRIAGEMALQVSSFTQAIEHFQRVLELLDAAAETSAIRQERAEILAHMGTAMQYRGDFADALDHLHTALDVFEQIDDRAGIARTLNTIGEVHWRRGNFQDAIAACERSLTLARELDDSRLTARALNRIGMVYYDQGEYDQAQVQFTEGLTHAETSQDAQCRVDLTNNLGLIAYARGNYAAASQRFEEIVQLSRETGERRRVANVLINLGAVAGQQRDYERATHYFEESLEITREIGERRGMDLALNNLGVLARLQGNYSRATFYFEQSLMLARAMNNRQGIARLSVNLGHVARAQDDVQRALDLYTEAMAIALKIDATPMLLDIFTGLVEVVPETAESIAWLGMVLDHDAADDNTRQKAQASLEKMANLLPDPEINAALERGKTLDLREAVMAVIERYGTPRD